MEELNDELIKLLSSEECKPKSSHIYNLIANLKVSEEEYKNFDLVQKLYLLHDQGIIRKDLVYLSFLVNDDSRLLKKVLAFDESMLLLNVEDVTTFYDFTYQRNRHWFLEIIKKDFSNLDAVFNEEMLRKVNLLKFYNVTNYPRIDLELINKKLANQNLPNDDFAQIYVKEISHMLDIVKFCLSISEQQINNSELYYYLSKHNLLETLSKFLNLKKSEYWMNILELIEQHAIFIKNTYVSKEKPKNENYKEAEIFVSFCVILNTLQSIQLCHELKSNDEIGKENISHIMQTSKTMIRQIKNDALLVETLENMFSLIFVREEHFLSNSSLSYSKFYCHENELLLILSFMKTLITEIKTIKEFDKTSNIYQRLLELNNKVTDALWRLELITCISKTPIEINKNVLPYLLAPPKSLINLCLKNDDFQKAHQVVQVCVLLFTFKVSLKLFLIVFARIFHNRWEYMFLFFHQRDKHLVDFQQKTSLLHQCFSLDSKIYM